MTSVEGCEEVETLNEELLLILNIAAGCMEHAREKRRQATGDNREVGDT